MSYIVSDINKSRNNLDEVQKLISGLNSEQQKLVISSSKLPAVERTKLELLLGETSAISANTVATKAQTVAEEDELLEQWLLIDAEEADTVATVANTSAKTGELSVITMLKVAWMKLIAVIKSHPYTAAITAIIATTYGAIKASEAWSNRLKKQAQESSKAYKDTLEEIGSINSELQSNEQRIDELNAKENLTLVEAEELEKLKESNRELENTIALKEKISQQENTKANKDAIKYFKEDTHTYNNETGKFSSTHIEQAAQYLDELYKKEQRIHEIELEMSRTDSNTEKYRELSGELDITQKSYEDLLQRVQDYNDVFTDLDDYLFEGQDDKLIQQLDDFYNYMNEVLYGVAKTHTDTIRDILAKADFQSVSKQLEELGKSGELSIDTLSSRFKPLIDYLDEAGISAEELYQYIMALSNPDAINYSEVKKQLLYSIGGRQDEASKFLNEILSLDDEELVLEAYIKVRDQYGEHPEGWTGKDWIANIQNELNDEEPVEIQVSLSISQTVDQLNTQLKPAMDSLKSAYQDIFSLNEDTGEQFFSLEEVGIETFESIRAELEKLDEIDGIAVDYSSFERFVSVLSDTSSTAEEVQQQFDNLATSIIYTTDCTNMSAETYNLLVKSLTEMGVTNATEVLTNLKDIQKELVSLGYDVANITSDEAEELIDLGSVSAEAAEYLGLYLFKKELAQNPLNTTADILALEKLCNSLGITSELYKYVVALKKAFDAKEHGAVSAGLDESIEFYQNKIADLANGQGDFKFNFSTPSATNSASKAGKEAGDAYADAFEEELKELDDLHSNSFISEKEYLDRLRVLYERYFKDKLGYEKEFSDYQKKYLDGYKSLYESVFSHASKVIGDRIDAINDEKDSAIDSLETQKKAAEDSYNAQIKLLEDKKDALQVEIDKIKEANEDRKEAIDLQKAEYELARMQNQRTILQYSEDKGVHYVTDTSGIRDARNDLDDKKADAQIRALEKQQDALDKQIDAIQEMLDASNEYWDTQIEQTEKYYDAMIQGMEEYKSRWEELSDLQEQAEMAALLEKLGYIEEDLADADSGAFDRLRNSYLGILKDMNDGNQSVLDGLSRLANIDMSSIPSFLSITQGYIDSIANMDVTALSDGLGNICDNFSNVADSAANAASAISGNGGTSSGNSNGNNPSGKGSANNNKNNANNGISLKDAITEVSTGSTQEINKISDAFAGENEEGTSVTSAIQKVMDKIGNADADNENTDSLMSTLTEQTDAALNEESGIPAQTNAWDELNTPLGESVDLVTTLQSTLEDMDGRTFTVTLNVAGNGSPNSIISELSGGVSNSPGHGGGGKSRARVQGTANVDGTANAEGNWGVKKAGLSLVGELGQELWVHSKDGTFETVGDNGAEFIDIKPNDIIFNHLQTKQLLDKGNIIGRGKSYANGSASVNGTNSEGWITLSNGLQARPLQEGDTSWDLTQKFQPLADRILKGETDIMSNAMIEHQRQMEQMVRDITTMNVTTGNNSSVTIGDIHVTCPGVTSHEVAKQVGDELNNMFRGLHLDAMQQSMMR
ncbi:MAG: hypothetical protein HDR12_17485 [Lachnospiraceae bacterium]|nr:hypothetical protein [Lachnospiraceae bacterium]